jgi:hypothetical protein
MRAELNLARLKGLDGDAGAIEHFFQNKFFSALFSRNEENTGGGGHSGQLFKI